MNNAKNHILRRLADAKAAGKLPHKIKFTTYADDAALKLFRPLEEWGGGAAEHRATMLSIAAEIAKLYPQIAVELIDIEIPTYFEWLAQRGLNDSDAARAAFISEYDE